MFVLIEYTNFDETDFYLFIWIGQIVSDTIGCIVPINLIEIYVEFTKNKIAYANGYSCKNPICGNRRQQVL